MLPLPVHPLRYHRHLLDRDWDTSNQESAVSINAPPSPTQTLRRRRHKRNRPTVPTTPHPASQGPNQYPTTNRTPVNQWYHFIEQEKPVEPLYQRPSRERLARLTPEQIHQAVVEQNVDLLNEVATQRKLPGYQFTHIAADVDGKGLCLKASQLIPASPWTNKTGLCEYSGTERSVDPQEHVNSIPLRQLTDVWYECEYYSDGKLYRKSPDQDMDSLLRFMQAPNPGEESTCRLVIVRDKPKSTMVSLFINRPIQPQEDLTIAYGGPY
jgi:hypothetical protein